MSARCGASSLPATKVLRLTVVFASFFTLIKSDLSLEECIDGCVYVREGYKNVITCVGFNVGELLVWEVTAFDDGYHPYIGRCNVDVDGLCSSQGDRNVFNTLLNRFGNVSEMTIDLRQSNNSPNLTGLNVICSSITALTPITANCTIQYTSTGDNRATSTQTDNDAVTSAGKVTNKSKDSLPVAAIAGGVAASVVLIAAVIVVVVVVCKRRAALKEGNVGQTPITTANSKISDVLDLDPSAGSDHDRDPYAVVDAESKKGYTLSTTAHLKTVYENQQHHGNHGEKTVEPEKEMYSRVGPDRMNAAKQATSSKSLADHTTDHVSEEPCNMLSFTPRRPSRQAMEEDYSNVMKHITDHSGYATIRYDTSREHIYSHLSKTGPKH